MKLKDSIACDNSGAKFNQAAAGCSCMDIINNDYNSDFIFRQLKTEKTEKQLVNAILRNFDVTETTASMDAGKIISSFRDAGMIDG